MSSEAFHALDAHMWRLAYKWAKRGHPNKPRHWITSRYFATFNPSRNDRWVFGDRDSGAYLRKFSWTAIVRHRLVKGAASTDDPALDQYWAERRRRGPPLDRATLRLLQAQDGRCPLCGDLLLHADRGPQTPTQWELWLTATRRAIARRSVTLGCDGTSDRFHLVHLACHRRATGTGRRPAPQRPQGLA